MQNQRELIYVYSLYQKIKIYLKINKMDYFFQTNVTDFFCLYVK